MQSEKAGQFAGHAIHRRRRVTDTEKIPGASALSSLVSTPVFFKVAAAAVVLPLDYRLRQGRGWGILKVRTHRRWGQGKAYEVGRKVT